jgi:hypothetical protein
MSRERDTQASLFSQIDVSGVGPPSRSEDEGQNAQAEQTLLLRELLAAQDRQNELLEELIQQVGAVQRQKAKELGQWKRANPDLSQKCRRAAEALSRVQTEFLSSLTEEIDQNYEIFLDGEFMLNEFVDRFGPRLAHLNGVLQVLGQLASAPGQ